MYTLELRSPAKTQLKRLDATIRKQVLEKLNELCANFKTRRHIALKGRDRGRFKLQVGNYRAVYAFDKQTRVVVVHRVAHRSKVYS